MELFNFGISMVKKSTYSVPVFMVNTGRVADHVDPIFICQGKQYRSKNRSTLPNLLSYLQPVIFDTFFLFRGIVCFSVLLFHNLFSLLLLLI